MIERKKKINSIQEDEESKGKREQKRNKFEKNNPDKERKITK